MGSEWAGGRAYRLLYGLCDGLIRLSSNPRPLMEPLTLTGFATVSLFPRPLEENFVVVLAALGA